MQCARLIGYCPSNMPVGVLSMTCGTRRIGDKCRLSCEQNYTGVPTEVTCLADYPSEGVWNGSIDCTRNCPAFTLPIGYEFASTCSNTSYNSVCLLRCSHGYSGDVVNPVCGDNGVWTLPFGCEQQSSIDEGDYSTAQEAGVAAYYAVPGIAAVITAAALLFMVAKRRKAKPVPITPEVPMKEMANTSLATL